MVRRILDAALYVFLGTLMSDFGLLGVDMRYFAAILCFVFRVSCTKLVYNHTHHRLRVLESLLYDQYPLLGVIKDKIILL